MEEILKSVKGTNGQLELLKNKIRIKRTGLTPFLLHGLKGDKEIFINQISSIQFKKPGLLTAGYIQFVFLGSAESKGGLLAAVEDENTVTFNNDTLKDFLGIKEMIEQKIEEIHNPNKAKDNSLNDLERLAELKNKGIITEEEFNLKKKKILGI